MSYHFQRPETLSKELKIWEAYVALFTIILIIYILTVISARATSAAPRVFKPFLHEPSKQVYLDGAIFHNNPIAIAERERKLIWRSLRDECPDILVSIGTSFSSERDRSEINRGNRPHRGVVAHGRALLQIAKDHVSSSLDCERSWDDFLNSLPKIVKQSRYIRLNPELDGHVPTLDEVGCVESIQNTVRTLMSRNPIIQQLAFRLTATSFYFELMEPILEISSGGYSAQGMPKLHGNVVVC